MMFFSMSAGDTSRIHADISSAYSFSSMDGWRSPNSSSWATDHAYSYCWDEFNRWTDLPIFRTEAHTMLLASARSILDNGRPDDITRRR